MPPVEILKRSRTTGERVAPLADIHEKLGIGKPAMLPAVFGVDLRRLTITDGPARGEWVDRRAVLRWLEANNESIGGSSHLERMIREYREAVL